VLTGRLHGSSDVYADAARKCRTKGMRLRNSFGVWVHLIASSRAYVRVERKVSIGETAKIQLWSRHLVAFTVAKRRVSQCLVGLCGCVGCLLESCSGCRVLLSLPVLSAQALLSRSKVSATRPQAWLAKLYEGTCTSRTVMQQRIQPRLRFLRHNGSHSSSSYSYTSYTKQRAQ
jgi:hypothetical protein